jgi:hypothetical protein
VPDKPSAEEEALLKVSCILQELKSAKRKGFVASNLHD